MRLRDHHCAFPFCGRGAECCDVDHATAYTDGGLTCPCNLVPACRRHHRAKTFSAWRYLVVEPGSYLWTSPHGRQWLVDHRGTRALDPPEPVDPDPWQPPDWADPGWHEPDRGRHADDTPRRPVEPCPGTHRASQRELQPALFGHPARPPDQ